VLNKIQVILFAQLKRLISNLEFKDRIFFKNDKILFLLYKISLFIKISFFRKEIEVSTELNQ